MHVRLQWLQWSDAGGGGLASGTVHTVKVPETWPISRLWELMKGDVPCSPFRTDVVERQRLLHSLGTLRSNHVKDNAFLYVILRSAE